MFSSSLVVLLLCVFFLVLFLPFSSGNTPTSQVNGTRGAPWLWRCHHTFSKPFQPKKSLIYWQGHGNSNTVAFMYNEGKLDLDYQSPSFKNRTKIFPDQLSNGNLSLVIEKLTLKDDNTSLEVVFKSHDTMTLCQTTLYVAAPFQGPELEINQSNRTATCRTKGGYPKPEITWTSQDGRNQSERTLEQHEVKTTMNAEEDGTYSISSTANITGSQRVTCRVHNPTSNKTLNATEDTTDKMNYLLLLLLPIVIVIVVWIIKRRPCSNGGTLNCCSSANGGPVGGHAAAAPPNMQNENAEPEPERVSLLPVDQSAHYRSSVRRDDATASATNEDSEAEQETEITESDK